MIVLLTADVVELAVRVPDTEMVCAAALVIVPVVVPDTLPSTPVAFTIFHVAPTWLAGTEIV